MYRLIIGFVILVLLIILLIQNLQVASFNFLIWSFEASLSIMLLLTIISTIAATILLIVPYLIINKFKKRKVKKDPVEEIKKVDQAA